MESGTRSGNGGRISARVVRAVVIVIALALLLAGGFYGWRTRETALFFRPESLFSRFPAAQDATAVAIDFAALRHAGLLSASPAPLEPEYKAFLEGTGFDYRRDLDYLAASLSPSGNYFIARGRFDRARLRAYALRQGGSCYQQLCRMQGTQPERHISFLPLRDSFPTLGDDAIALAVGPDDLAATRLTKTGPPLLSKIPSVPVWMSVPGAALRARNMVPAGVRIMLSALTNADRVVITVAPGGSGIEAHLETGCRTQDEARALTSQLRSTTALLKDAVPRDQSLRNDDLARALASGVFEQAGLRVTGRWPVPKSLIESLTAGI